ncbi:MAG: TetR/AcrR family transcriptional regulator [Hyphomicrobiales bacterium]|nr:MAG: TetR/AcrR family transcriptional regulator [Hyphomicrobiales bacterium]
MVDAKPSRGVQRREALLQAATDVFLEQGYAATSIDAIIERAGGSKRNIYSEFGNKENLFTAIVAANAAKAVAALAIEEIDARDLRSTLTVFGHRLMDIYMSPSLLGVYRVIISESQRFPALVKKFYNQGPGRASARLAEVLEQARARGDIETADCVKAADHFVSMIRGNLHLQVLVGLRSPPRAKEVAEMVESVVELFLRGVTAR